MIDAYMTPDDLTACIEDSGYSRAKCAALLGVTERELRQMEAGEEPIPARFDDDIWQLDLDGGEPE